MKSDGTKTFGPILRGARERKGFSLGRAADVLGVPKTPLWRWENNETKIDAQRPVDIASTYGFSVASMFQGNTFGPSRYDAMVNGILGQSS